MSDWTLGAVKARNMDLLAMCEASECGHIGFFDLDMLIDGAGPDFRIDDIPPMACPECGAKPLAIRLAMGGPPEERDQ